MSCGLLDGTLGQNKDIRGKLGNLNEADTSLTNTASSLMLITYATLKKDVGNQGKVGRECIGSLSFQHLCKLKTVLKVFLKKRSVRRG